MSKSVLLVLLVVMLQGHPPGRVYAGELKGKEPDRSEPRKRPNLLLIVADDHRGGTLGIDGDPRHATPRLDALARRGVRFTHAYCNAPVCTPSRQSFITGKLPHAVGVTRLTTVLPESAVTLGDRLVKLGYDTAAIGKMHFNSQAHHGFQTRIDQPEYQTWLRANPPKNGNGQRPWRPFTDPASVWLNADRQSAGLPAKFMESTFFADRAIEFLKNRGNDPDPFALVVGFYDPHSPFKFPRNWDGLFRRDQFTAPPVSESDRQNRPKIFRDLTDRDALGIQAAYYSSLSFVDSQIGRVVDALGRAGLSENTVVVYLGDNGYMLGEHGRFEKHCFYEPAVKVPLIVSWDHHLAENRQVNGMVELVDLFPTVLELLGVAVPADAQGRSFIPLLKGKDGAKGRDVVFSEYLENEEAMVRSERYKLVVGTGARHRLDGYETDQPLPGPYQRLFDLKDDPGETTDLAERPELSDVKAQLLERLYERLVTTRPDSDPVPKGLSRIEAIHWCLVPRDVEPNTAKALLMKPEHKTDDRPSNQDGRPSALSSSL